MLFILLNNNPKWYVERMKILIYRLIFNRNNVRRLMMLLSRQRAQLLLHFRLQVEIMNTVAETYFWSRHTRRIGSVKQNFRSIRNLSSRVYRCLGHIVKVGQTPHCPRGRMVRSGRPLSILFVVDLFRKCISDNQDFPVHWLRNNMYTCN